MAELERCALMKRDKNICNALKETKCLKCKFYLSRDELNRKNKKVIDWYSKRGLVYDDVVFNIFKKENENE